MRHPAYPKSVCGVVYQGSERRTGCQFSFTCDGSLLRAPMARPVARGAVGRRRRARRPCRAAASAPLRITMPITCCRNGPSSSARSSRLGRHIFYRFIGGWGRAGAFNGTWTGIERIPALDLAALRVPSGRGRHRHSGRRAARPGADRRPARHRSPCGQRRRRADRHDQGLAAERSPTRPEPTAPIAPPSAMHRPCPSPRPRRRWRWQINPRTWSSPDARTRWPARPHRLRYLGRQPPADRLVRRRTAGRWCCGPPSRRSTRSPAGWARSSRRARSSWSRRPSQRRSRRSSFARADGARRASCWSGSTTPQSSSDAGLSSRPRTSASPRAPRGSAAKAAPG